MDNNDGVLDTCTRDGLGSEEDTDHVTMSRARQVDGSAEGQAKNVQEDDEGELEEENAEHVNDEEEEEEDFDAEGGGELGAEDIAIEHEDCSEIKRDDLHIYIQSVSDDEGTELIEHTSLCDPGIQHSEEIDSTILVHALSDGENLL